MVSTAQNRGVKAGRNRKDRGFPNLLYLYCIADFQSDFLGLKARDVKAWAGAKRRPRKGNQKDLLRPVGPEPAETISKKGTCARASALDVTPFTGLGIR